VGIRLISSKWHIRYAERGITWLQKEAVKRMTRKKAEEEANHVDWQGYFSSIRDVCPWSAPAYNKGKIDIQVWKGKPRDLEDNLAIVYVHKHASSRLLNKIADRMMSARPAEEWLYSHPRFKGHSTEVPVLIQQDLAHLSRARQKGEKI